MEYMWKTFFICKILFFQSGAQRGATGRDGVRRGVTGRDRARQSDEK